MDCEICIHFSVCGLKEKYRDLKIDVVGIIQRSMDPKAENVRDNEGFFRPTLLCEEYREEGD